MALTAEGANGNRSAIRKGTIRFVPGEKLPYSNKIGLVQIVKLQDNTGTDVNPVSLPATTGPHVRTTEDNHRTRPARQSLFYLVIMAQLDVHQVQP